jgi:hypothetical protein
LGAVLVEEGKKGEARTCLQDAVRILTAALGKDSVRTKQAQAALDSL